MKRSLPLVFWLLVACAAPAFDRAALTVPDPDISQLEPSLAEWLLGVRDDVASKVADEATNRADLAKAFGDYGQVLHAFDLREAAIDTYAHAQDLAPEDFRWPYLSARLKEFLGDLDGAEQDLRQALAIDPEAAHAWVRLGDVQRAVGDESAKDSYEQALELRPSAEAWFGLGQVQMAGEEFAAAVASFERALDLQPSASVIYAPMAQALRSLGREEEADRALARRGRQSVVAADPTVEALGDVRILGTYSALFSMAAADELTADELLGFTLTQLGDVDGSEEALVRDLSALEGEDSPDTRRQRARLHYALGGLRVYLERDEQATGNFLRALELDPDLLPAELKLGNLLARRGAFAEAVERYDRTLVEEPDNVEALVKRGTALLNLRQADRAVRDLERAQALDPAEPLAQVRLAEALEVRGDFPGAERRLRQAAASTDLDARGRALVLRGLGDFLVRRQRLDAAAAALAQALEEDRTLTSARMRLADVLATLGRFEEALREYDAVVADQPSNIVAHLHRAGVLLLTQQWAEAVVSLDIGLELNPGDSSLEHQLARVLAANPDVRDPERALQLASGIHEQQPTAMSAVTLSLALAGRSRFDDAISIEARLPDGPLKQRRLAAYREGRPYVTSDAREMLLPLG